MRWIATLYAEELQTRKLASKMKQLKDESQVNLTYISSKSRKCAELRTYRGAARVRVSAHTSNVWRCKFDLL